jgi:hypothetical protein
VIECGLGADTTATNIVAPAVTVIHVDRFRSRGDLGTTLEGDCRRERRESSSRGIPWSRGICRRPALRRRAPGRLQARAPLTLADDAAEVTRGTLGTAWWRCIPHAAVRVRGRRAWPAGPAPGAQCRGAVLALERAGERDGRVPREANRARPGQRRAGPHARLIRPRHTLVCSVDGRHNAPARGRCRLPADEYPGALHSCSASWRQGLLPMLTALRRGRGRSSSRKPPEGGPRILTRSRRSHSALADPPRSSSSAM